MSYKCKRHPKYKVKFSPRSLCEACWWLWFARKGKKLTDNYAEGLMFDGSVIDWEC